MMGTWSDKGRDGMDRRLVVLGTVLFILTGEIAAAQQEGGRIERSFSAEKGRMFKTRVEGDAGRVTIRGSDRPEEGSVSVHYKEDAFQVQVDLDEKNRELRIRLDKRDWLEGFDQDAETALSIALPKAAENLLEVDLKAGGLKLDLTDVRVRDLELRGWVGEMDVNFGVPNRSVIDELEITLHVGKASLRNLGNANFEEAEINSDVGTLFVDFSGHIRRDGRVKIDTDVGQLTLLLPRKVGVELSVSNTQFLSRVKLPDELRRRSGRIYYSPNYEIAPHRLSLNLQAGVGSVEIKWAE